ncbi:MAG: class I adenylate cyclase [Thermodesulfobacteriota bacterium]|nr:class I adenylate cyclase [Thermodesulfobacteriota bacterium]
MQSVDLWVFSQDDQVFCLVYGTEYKKREYVVDMSGVMADRTSVIERNREFFECYNSLRLKQAIERFSSRKKDIFIKIPFLIHTNIPGCPGFVDSNETGGIFYFEKSPLFRHAKRFAEQVNADESNLSPDRFFIQGLYHIGSLGTLTQSKGSDFDFWVLVDTRSISTPVYAFLDRKLKKIQKYCRDVYNQQVSFFIHDAEKIKQNNFAPIYGENLSIAPIGLLKEEFYRTCITIAGKIPLWFVVPPGVTDEDYNSFAETVLSLRSLREVYVNLGNLESINKNELSRGVLWHISKSRDDSAKALIKASLAASYCLQEKDADNLLCDTIKRKYLLSLDEKELVDSYVLAFDRIIDFYGKLKAGRRLGLIKLAIFFRLCGYPFVAPPATDLERRILKKYIHEWHLGSSKVKKMLAYQNWSESEKNILEQSFTNGIAYLYNFLKKVILKNHNMSPREQNELTILQNKTIEYLKEKPGKIPRCSVYLKSRRFCQFRIWQKSSEAPKNFWILFAAEQPEEGSQHRADSRGVEKFLYSEDSLTKVLGWVMSNMLYHYAFSKILVDSPVRLFDSFNQPVDFDAFYLALQPWPQLSDSFFAKPAFWDRIIVIINCGKKKGKPVINAGSCLIKNSWGEIFYDDVRFEEVEKIEDKCYAIARKIKKYAENGLNLFLFQLAENPVESVIERVREIFDFLSFRDKSVETMPAGKRKPYLDLL